MRSRITCGDLRNLASERLAQINKSNCDFIKELYQFEARFWDAFVNVLNTKSTSLHATTTIKNRNMFNSMDTVYTSVIDVLKLFEFLFVELQKTLALDVIDEIEIFKQQFNVNLNRLRLHFSNICDSLKKLKTKYSGNTVLEPVVDDTISFLDGFINTYREKAKKAFNVL